MYSGYELTEKSRQKLRYLYPPTHPDFIGHHITEQFGGSPPLPEQPSSIKIVGHVITDKIEGFLVELNGTTDRPDGSKYHITWSIDRSKGAKPVHTNDVISKAKAIQEIPIEVIPKVFK